MRSKARAAQIVGHPQVAHEQPTPVRVPSSAANEVSVVPGEHRDLPVLLGRRNREIRGDEVVYELLHVIQIGIVGRLDFECHILEPLIEIGYPEASSRGNTLRPMTALPSGRTRPR